MDSTLKDSTVGTVRLTASAEAALQAHVRRCGGRVLTTGDTTAAEAVSAALALVERTLALVELPPIIHDRVPRDLSR